MWKGKDDCRKAWQIVKGETLIKRRDKKAVIRFDDHRWKPRILGFKQKSRRNARSWKSAEIIRQYEDIIKMKKKGIINVAFHQGQIFKRFKEKEKFAKLVSELGIHKTTIIFKINVFKLCEK